MARVLPQCSAGLVRGSFGEGAAVCWSSGGRAMLWTALCPLLLVCVPGADEKPATSKDRPSARGTDRRSEPDASPERIRRLIRQLGSSSFKEREAAERALIELGAAAEGQVRRAMKDDDPEVARRA